MQTRYYITEAFRVPNGTTPVIRTGLPVGQDMISNLVIGCVGSYDFIHLNARILREALLRDPNETAKLLGIKVSDLFSQPAEEPKPAAKRKPKVSQEEKPKEVKEETIN